MTEELAKLLGSDDERFLKIMEWVVAGDVEHAKARVALGNLLLQGEIEKTRAEYAVTMTRIQQLYEAAEVYGARDEASKPAPPRLAAFLLAFIAPKNSAQAFLGDLQEMFQKNVDRFGETQARRVYWSQVASSFGPLLLQWLKRIGFFTVLIDYFRSIFGL